MKFRSLFIFSILFFLSPLIRADQTYLIHPNDLKNHVIALASIYPYRNYQNPDSLNKTAEYIRKKLLSYGLSPKEQVFQVREVTYKNLEFEIGPTSEKKIVIGAHYDVAGDQQGADDNASGVAALLELAKILKLQEKNLKYRVHLVAYTLEEPPYFRTESMGSFKHAKSLRDKNEEIELMISLETIGYYSEEKGSQDYPVWPLSWIYPSQGNFIALVGRNKESEYLSLLKKVYNSKTTIPCESIAAPESLSGIDFSDHLNYWKFNYKAIMITDTAFLRNKNYHETSDLPETLNYDKIAEVIRGLAHFLTGK
ncbi:M28 family peptidase [Leptospira sarikeiensis]|uniref:M28 family peptidase n=1 Tax=Leptospira sarikeiensis TaxID=2484943 RepID=A0A4R9K7F6_9LEPT|nr:M28 family peptidase [Leptospira sarikeiensis]TGL60605.1 M28 family peptidase [Leptospira sarikeiensis]